MSGRDTHLKMAQSLFKRATFSHRYAFSALPQKDFMYLEQILYWWSTYLKVYSHRFSIFAFECVRLRVRRGRISGQCRLAWGNHALNAWDGTVEVAFTGGTLLLPHYLIKAHNQGISNYIAWIEWKDSVLRNRCEQVPTVHTALPLQSNNARQNRHGCTNLYRAA